MSDSLRQSLVEKENLDRPGAQSVFGIPEAAVRSQEAGTSTGAITEEGDHVSYGKRSMKRNRRPVKWTQQTAIVLVLLLAGAGCGEDGGSTQVEDATAFWEAVEAGDLDAALAHVDPTADLATFSWAVAPLEATLDWYEAVGWKWTLNECVEGDAETVECTATARNAWSDALEVEPVPGIFVFRFGENGIIEIVDKADMFLNKWSPQVFEVFAGWVETNHPEDFAIMFGSSGDPSAEILDLYETNTNRFVQAQQDE